MIFTVTSVPLTHPKEKHNGESRCFGYYLTEEKAREAVEKNTGDMHECFYTHLVIEKVKEGIHPISTVVQWYEWNDTHHWVEIDSIPERFQNTINYGIG